MLEIATADYEQKKKLVKLVTHALVNQFIGNFVTMKFWQDVWLKDALATFIQYLAIDNLYPEYKIFNDFIKQITHQALKLNENIYSRPVSLLNLIIISESEVLNELSKIKRTAIILMFYDTFVAVVSKDLKD